ncbi:MAG: glycoside hydrolase family 30 beta sandwich domain-containing protein, partial [Planctomycetota bacterium]
VQPGAKFLPMRGHHGAFSLLFENPDGQLVLVAANPNPDDTTVLLDLPGLPESVHLRGRTFNTIWS